MENKFILDACCGNKYMWLNKNHPNCIYIDKRIEPKGFYDYRKNVEIKPDIQADFTDLSLFPDKKFKLIVWDPPHLTGKGYNSRMTQVYGFLNKETWPFEFKKGFEELWRCLDNYGVLIFKFNDNNIKFDRILKLFHTQPLFWNISSTKKNNTTKWFCFMKIPEEIGSKLLEGENGKM